MQEEAEKKALEPPPVDPATKLAENKIQLKQRK
jgi:hypothetical protein